MPYASVNDIPAYVKKYSKKIQSQWRHVFNTVYASTKGNEKRAVMAANSVLKTRFKKKESMINNTRDDYFNFLVDSFLDNLVG